MDQIVPCVNTLCSYSATSVPSARGVSRSSSSVLDGPVALEHPVRHEPVRRALGPHLLRGLAEGQRLALGEHVRGEQVVVARPSGFSVCAKPMKSAGISSVPWWISW